MRQRIRPAVPDDVGACARIVRDLPDFFTTDVPDQVHDDLQTRGGWVIADDSVRGFVVVDRRTPSAVEILWAAVAPHRHRRGLGTRLLRTVLDELHREDVRLVEVKTLDGTAGYKPYEGTRAFWERMGFVQIDTLDPMPGWQPGNPCAVYVAALRSTRV